MTKKLTPEELAAEFGVEDLSDITGDGDELYAEYENYIQQEGLT